MLCGDFQGAEGAEVMTNYTFNDTQCTYAVAGHKHYT